MLNPIQYKIKKGATSQQIWLRFANQISFVPQTSISEATAGLVIRYHRGSTLDAVSIAPVSITNLSSSHNPGGIKHVVDGFCRVDIPDAVLANGGPLLNRVIISASATGVVSGGAIIELTDFNPQTNNTQSTPEVY